MSDGKLNDLDANIHEASRMIKYIIENRADKDILSELSKCLYSASIKAGKLAKLIHQDKGCNDAKCCT